MFHILELHSHSLFANTIKSTQIQVQLAGCEKKCKIAKKTAKLETLKT